MAVKIRLRRLGDKRNPFYRVVVADSRVARDGKYIDLVGTYNPIANPAEIKFENEKVLSWLSKGAIPTDTVKSLLIQAEVIPAPAKRAPAKTKAQKKKQN